MLLCILVFALSSTTSHAVSPAFASMIEKIKDDQHRRLETSKDRTTDEDHVVDIEVSMYETSNCEKPVAEDGEPVVSHMESEYTN